MFDLKRCSFGQIDRTWRDEEVNRFQCFLYRHRDAVQIADRHCPLTCHGLRHTYAVEQYLACRKQRLDEHAACWGTSVKT